MVFNWFRRQYDKDKDKAQKQPETTPPPESKVESTEPSASPEPEVAEDYLAWAKAASFRYGDRLHVRLWGDRRGV